jgi:hypothetical protein
VGWEGGVDGSSTTATNLMRLSVFLHGCTRGKCRNGLTHDSQFHPLYCKSAAAASFVLSSSANVVGRVEISFHCRFCFKTVYIIQQQQQPGQPTPCQRQNSFFSPFFPNDKSQKCLKDSNDDIANRSM